MKFLEVFQGQQTQKIPIFYTEVIVVTGRQGFALQAGSRTRNVLCTRQHTTVDTLWHAATRRSGECRF